ncbi:MAG TPA: hypothetical protein VGH32_10440, partial [Pirellulales bacterium]
AMATLDRVLSSLDRYVSTTAPRPMAKPSQGGPDGAGSMAMPLDEPVESNPAVKNDEPQRLAGADGTAGGTQHSAQHVEQSERRLGGTAASGATIDLDVDAAAAPAAAGEEARS